MDFDLIIDLVNRAQRSWELSARPMQGTAAPRSLILQRPLPPQNASAVRLSDGVGRPFLVFEVYHGLDRMGQRATPLWTERLADYRQISKRATVFSLNSSRV